MGQSVMGIDMRDETDMAIAVMHDQELVFCKSFADYYEFNEAVQELQKKYNIPNTQILYEND